MWKLAGLSCGENMGELPLSPSLRYTSTELWNTAVSAMAHMLKSKYLVSKFKV